MVKANIKETIEKLGESKRRNYPGEEKLKEQFKEAEKQIKKNPPKELIELKKRVIEKGLLKGRNPDDKRKRRNTICFRQKAICSVQLFHDILYIVLKYINVSIKNAKTINRTNINSKGGARCR